MRLFVCYLVFNKYIWGKPPPFLFNIEHLIFDGLFVQARNKYSVPGTRQYYHNGMKPIYGDEVKSDLSTNVDASSTSKYC
jgi:hypothetical protein